MRWTDYVTRTGETHTKKLTERSKEKETTEKCLCGSQNNIKMVLQRQCMGIRTGFNRLGTQTICVIL